jgi:hypothetical protein
MGQVAPSRFSEREKRLSRLHERWLTKLLERSVSESVFYEEIYSSGENPRLSMQPGGRTGGERLKEELRFAAGVDPMSGSPKEKTTYGYDDLGRLVEEVRDEGDDGGSFSSH